jgi:hypothetical protein
VTGMTCVYCGGTQIEIHDVTGHEQIEYMHFCRNCQEYWY